MKGKHAIPIMLLIGAFALVGFIYIAMAGEGEEQTAKAEPAPTDTASPTATFLPSATPSPTFTATVIPSSTATATVTPTLETQVVQLVAVMPGVELAQQATPFPPGFQVLKEVPVVTEPIPNATLSLTNGHDPFEGWVSFESDHPALDYTAGEWVPIGSRIASQGQYHYSLDKSASLRFSFTGQGLRIHYVTFNNGGIFEVWIDGSIVDAIDSYSAEAQFPGTKIYTLLEGTHEVELRNAGMKNHDSAGYMLALDAIQVYHPDALTYIGDLPTSTPSPTYAPIRNIQQIQGPPTIQPTFTAIPPAQISVSIIVAYDENSNRQADVNEGVKGISVRLVEVESNRVIAQAFTDERGYAQVQAVTNLSAQLVIPYFSGYYPVSGRSTNTPIILLLEAGNQPGLIP